MRKVEIQQIRVGRREIRFRPGVNYIVGALGTGKTVLFNSMRFGLGLTNLPKYVVGVDEVGIDIRVGADELHFVRNSNDDKIVVRVGGELSTYRPKSVEYRSFLKSVLFERPKGLSHFLDTRILLDECFISETMLETPSVRDRILAQLGIDRREERELRRYLREFDRDTQNRRNMLATVDKYKAGVGMQLAQALPGEQFGIVDEVLNSEFNKLLRVYEKDKAEYEQAEHSIRQLESINRDKVANATVLIDSSLESFDRAVFGEPMTTSSVLFEDDPRYESFSSGMASLAYIARKLVIQAKYKSFYSCGLIVVDGLVERIGFAQLPILHDLIESCVRSDGLQYVEFVRSDRNIDRDRVIYDMEKSK